MTPTITDPLEWSEEILQEIFRHTPVGVVLGDLQGTIFDANDAFCAIVDFPRELIVGQQAAAFLFANDLPRAAEIFAELGGHGTSSYRTIHKVQARSGRSIWVNTTISHVVSSTNEPICLIAFVEDISERVAAENALRQNEALYRQVVENQTDMIVRTDGRGIRLFANPEYAKFFGLSEASLTNTSSLPLIYEPDRDAVLAGMALLTAADPVRTFTYRVVAADGSIRWTEWTSHASFDLDGRVSVLQSIGRDVTDRISANEALRASEARYRRLFDDLPGAAWESDWSGVVSLIREVGLHSSEEFLAYASGHPAAVRDGIHRVRPLAANSAALAMAGVEDLDAFSNWLVSAYAPSSIPTLLRAVASLVFESAMTARAELSMFGPDGELHEVDFRWARIRLPQSEWRIINTLSDVTELKRIERELRQSEQMYRDLFNRLPEAAWEVDWSAPLAKWRAAGIRSSDELMSRFPLEEILRMTAECEVIIVNERALELAGIRDATSFATSRWLAIAPEERETIARGIARVLFGEQPSSTIDVGTVRADGRWKKAVMTSAVNQAFPGRVTNTAVDITERMIAEEALRQSESLYRLLFHNMPIAVWDTDWSNALERWKRDGVETVDDAVAWLRGGDRTREELKQLRRLVQANQNALELAAATGVESFEDWAATAIRPEDIDRVVPSILSVILGIQQRASVEARVARTDGSLMDMELHIVAQQGLRGRVISAAIDMTDRKRIERDLLHSQMLLETAQAIAHTGSWEASIETDELFGSREHWNIIDGDDSGPTRRRLSTSLEAVHPEDRAGVWQTLLEAHDEFVASGRNGGERTHEYRLVRPDGSLRVVRAQGIFTRTADGEVRAYGVLQDITEQKKAEEASQRQREELTRADRMISLGILVSGVAHEINNPNHLIMLNAPLLRAVWADVAPIVDEHAGGNGDVRIGGLPWSEMRSEVPDLIAEVEGAAERIRAIVSELRGFARDQRSGELKAQSVNDIIRGSLRLLANHLKKATKHFTLDLAKDLPLVDASAQRLEQVVVNLVLNSCQALPDPEAGITVSTALDEERRRVQIQVVDEGIGIQPDDLRKIRDPFFTTKRAEGGMGLGLAVSERIVQEHNGVLTFESEPGRGTTAIVSLPISGRG